MDLAAGGEAAGRLLKSGCCWRLGCWEAVKDQAAAGGWFAGGRAAGRLLKTRLLLEAGLLEGCCRPGC